jgi:hypothetical protein
LPECQVFEGEVDAGSERRAQGSEQSEYDGHCSPWLARRAPIVQSQIRVLANDNPYGSQLGPLDAVIQNGVFPPAAPAKEVVPKGCQANAPHVGGRASTCTQCSSPASGSGSGFASL